MDFIKVDDAHLALYHAFVKGLELFDKLGSLGGIRFGQQFLAFFPTQTGLLQKGAECTAADGFAQLLCHPPSQLFHGPIVAR